MEGKANLEINKIIFNVDQPIYRHSGVSKNIANEKLDFVEKWGLIFLLILISLIICCLYMIKYTEYISCNATVKVFHQSYDVSMYNGGQINQILVKDSDVVHQGDTIVIYENQSNHQNHAILAPIDGVLSYKKGIRINSLLPPKASIASIISTQDLFYLKAPSEVIDSSRRVLIRFRKYPSDIFGQLEKSVVLNSIHDSMGAAGGLIYLSAVETTNLGSRIIIENNLDVELVDARKISLAGGILNNIFRQGIMKQKQ